MSKVREMYDRVYTNKMRIIMYSIGIYVFSYGAYLGYMAAVEASKPWYQVW